MAKRRTGTPGHTETAAGKAGDAAARSAARGSAGATPTRAVGAPSKSGLTPELPAWAPATIYAVVTVLLFREFFLSGTSMLGLDSIALSYFARNFYTEFVQTFQRMPYWNPLLFGGLPFVEGMHGDIFYPPSLALFFMDARTMWGWKMALHIFLAGVFTYLWLHRGLQLDRLPAFFGGLVFMMGADLVTLVLPGGDGKLFVSTLAPLVFWLAERAVRGRRPADFAVFALGIALILFTSHMQAAYYVVWGASLYFLFRVWQVWQHERSGAVAARLVGMYALAGVLGVGAAAVQFLPPLEYLREHSHRADRADGGERGYDWSSTYSLNAEEIVSLVVPEFVGEIAQSSRVRPAGGYWGKNPGKLNHEYAGLVPLLLIPILLLRRRTPQVLFFVGLALLSLLYALASSTPLGRLFYLIPGVSLFRSWSIIIFLYGLSVATLGALAVQQLQDWMMAPGIVRSGRGRAGRGSAGGAGADEITIARRALWAAAAVFGVLALLASAGVLIDLWTAVFYRDIHPMRATALANNEAYIRTGFWLAFGIAVAVAGAWELGSRGLIGARALLLILAGIAAADLYRVGRPFVQHTALMNEQVAGSTVFQADDVIQYLQRLRDAGGVFRVMDLGPALQAPTSYSSNDFAIHGLEQLAGHHGNEIGRYRNLIGGEAADFLAVSDLRLAHITNTEYFVVPGRFEHASLEETYAGARSVIYRNVNALPRAYLVGRVEVLAGDAAIARLLAEDFDARSTVVLAEPLPADIEVTEGASGTVEWVERGTDAFTLRVAADRPALLVVLDNHYPAWEAHVDGRRVPVLRANHAFRAVPVPPGEHTVSFQYNPTALRGGALISLAVLALLLGVVAAGLLSARRVHPPVLAE